MNQNNSNILSVKALTIRFSGILALNKVDLLVKRGSITSLIGPNGAGKTTLFNCLTGFYAANEGEILFFTQEKIINIRQILGTSPIKYLKNPLTFLSHLYYKIWGGSHLICRAGIARTFQNIRLFREMTVIENLLVAQYRHNNRNLISGYFNTKAFQQSEKAALNHAFMWLEIFNLTSDANRLAGLLPYGKQRHLEIARAMCTKPTLLCLDEPAAGLNPHETHELREIILNLRKTMPLSILLIEHDMSLVMTISDHIIVLDHGEVICQGPPPDVQNNQRVIEAYLGIADDA
ncbi:MAG: ATP-binding cassette domain-containing protein [Proteobacteria bacterium]|nr:ATP-binding cassette domain-containing protein [Pseudomonadota bacterium]